MQIQVTVPEWLKLSQETRVRLAEKFQLSRSRGTQMEQQGEGSVLVSDGYSNSDLEGITLEKMQEYLQDTSISGDFVSLFHGVLEKIEAEKTMVRNISIFNPQKEVSTRELLLEEWAWQLQLLKNKATNQEMTQELVDMIKKTFEINTTPHESQRLPAKKERIKKSK